MKCRVSERVGYCDTVTYVIEIKFLFWWIETGGVGYFDKEIAEKTAKILEAGYD
jgi:hypothetical protein